jgi:hypothetical protein
MKCTKTLGKVKRLKNIPTCCVWLVADFAVFQNCHHFSNAWLTQIGLFFKFWPLLIYYK